MDGEGSGKRGHCQIHVMKTWDLEQGFHRPNCQKRQLSTKVASKSNIQIKGQLCSNSRNWKSSNPGGKLSLVYIIPYSIM